MIQFSPCEYPQMNKKYIFKVILIFKLGVIEYNHIISGCIAAETLCILCVVTLHNSLYLISLIKLLYYKCFNYMSNEMIPHRTASHRIAPHRSPITMPYTMPYSILYHTPYHSTPYHTILHHTILHHIPYHTTQN